MSSAGKRPKTQPTKAFFFCDRKKCGTCNPKCTHTQDPSHALSLEGEFKQNLVDGSMWQVGISVNGEIYDGKEGRHVWTH